MHRSIAAVSLGGSLREKLYAIAAAGFDSVELAEAELAFSEMSPRDIRQLLDELRLVVSLFHPVADVDGVAADVFAAVLARIDRKFELMAELGASLMRIPATATHKVAADRSGLVERLVKLADRAAKHDIRLGYEAIATGRQASEYRVAWQIVDAASHSHLGLIIDSFEVLASGSDPAPIANLPGDKLLLVQLADAPALPVDIATLGRHFRCFPGQGALDVAGFVRNVIESGYAGPYSLDVPSDVVRAAPIRAAALDGYRSLVFVEECLFASGCRPDEPVFGADGPPPQQQKESIGFVEFAVDADSQQELETWLTGMGFRYGGRHRSKDVTLYHQRGVLIILNSGSDSFAHYYHHLHGTSVCAIGLRLSDPDALLARADYYKYKRYAERIGPQEYMMPAVRAPDGSLLHALDTSYDPSTDFVLDSGETMPAEVIYGIDHLVRAVPEDQFDSWVLFYRALLGLTADSALELSDPHGIVRSRALHDARSHLRLPLAFSDNPKTVVARSLSSFGGAGINQIALATDDIFSAIAHMRNCGVPLLPIPANYYRELADNRDLDPELVERMREASILYDCDSNGGQFLHAYTDFFNGRFFFEIAQREGGYSRYGECNAPVRMAAQAKRSRQRLPGSQLSDRTFNGK